MDNVDSSRTRTEQNSSPLPRNARLFLLVSLTVNFGLVVFLAFLWRKPEPVTATRLADKAMEVSDSHPRKSLKLATARAASAWTQLESSDLAVYAANLRAAGCPPKTVRDILMPWVEENFELPEQDVFGPTNFWASFSERQTAAFVRAEQEKDLEEQKEKTLKDLLGFIWTTEGLRQVSDSEAIWSLGFLDYEQMEKVLCIGDRFKKQFGDADHLHRMDRRLAIYEAWRHEVGEALSPAEMEELELREVFMIWQRESPNVNKAALTGSELRQLVLLRRELCNPLCAGLFAKTDGPLPDTDWASEQQFNAKARALLGDGRFLNYLKTCDYGVERTLVALEKEHLPSTLALQLFDLRQDAVSRAEQIRGLPIRRAEKRMQLVALRQSAREQLATLPHANDSVLFRINEGWLQQIGNP